MPNEQLATLGDVKNASPIGLWVTLDVQFNAPYADTVIPLPFGLEPVRFKVVDTSVPGTVFRGTKPSTIDYIVLQATVAGLYHIQFFVEVTQKAVAVATGPTTAGASSIPKSALPASIAYEDEANVFTQDQFITKATPPYWMALLTGGGLDRARLGQNVQTAGTGRLDLSANLSFDGTNLNSDDVGKDSTQFTLFNGDFSFFYAPAGANPRTAALVELLRVHHNGGILFPATQIANADAHALDDYEEFTWTPTIGGSGGQSGQAYSSQNGYYIKIGKLVVAWAQLTLSTVGTVTGSVQIQGFPFTAENSTQLFPFGIMQWNVLATNWVNVQCFINGGTTVATVRGATAASTNNTQDLVQADLAVGTSFFVTMAYRAAN
jgi:hypothetical protein